MKKIVLLIAVSFLLMNQAYPQETKSLQVFINSGISLPLEPDYLKDYWRGKLLSGTIRLFNSSNRHFP